MENESEMRWYSWGLYRHHIAGMHRQSYSNKREQNGKKHGEFNQNWVSRFFWGVTSITARDCY